MKNFHLRSIVEKPYQERSNPEHKILCSHLKPFFPTLTQSKIKLLSFYVQSLEGPCELTTKNYQLGSFVITVPEEGNPEHPSSQMRIEKGKIAQVKVNQTALIITYKNYLNCESLGQTTIEEEVSFMNQSEYLCSMPHKKYYYLLKNCQILNFHIGGTPFIENQQLTKQESGSGVYLIRKGQFAYFKKQVQTFNFEKGSIFGTLEIMKNNLIKRVMTAKSKTSNSIVYHFQENFFNQNIRKYCEAIILTKQSKLKKYIDVFGPQQQMKRSRSLHSNFSKNKSSDTSLINQHFSRTSFGSLCHNSKILPSLKVNFGLSNTKNICELQSEKIQREGLRKTNYLSLKNDGPLKNYPLLSQRSKYVSSEFKDIHKVRQKQMPGFNHANQTKDPLIKQATLSVYSKFFIRRRF